MRMNKDKCEYLAFRTPSKIQLANGEKVPIKSEVKYLGCNISNKGDTTLEVQQRRQECRWIFIDKEEKKGWSKERALPDTCIDLAGLRSLAVIFLIHNLRGMTTSGCIHISKNTT